MRHDRGNLPESHTGALTKTPVEAFPKVNRASSLLLSSLELTDANV